MLNKKELENVKVVVELLLVPFEEKDGKGATINCGRYSDNWDGETFKERFLHNLETRLIQEENDDIPVSLMEVISDVYRASLLPE